MLIVRFNCDIIIPTNSMSKGIPSYDDLLKNVTLKSLNSACYSYIKHQFDNNLLVMPHQWLIEAYEDLRKV